MRKIKMVPDAPFHNNCDVTVYDVTDGNEKRRCRINIEYAEVDVRQIKQSISTKEEALDSYKNWINDLIKYNIHDDWECVEGYDRVLKIIDEKITPYF
ncbi:hypothetical protein [Clostridium aminobutyricum]|uniref:Uncharacterized protein n=1 Tax=Clostridium aminobutyricum TaxID=33953 RepID=A0A939DAX0_CLOAM|nr:hypothetical protein [Clostridium aminobutyricum]MBN7773913.1 hypothetical protein [Clostridium aminobutyricum]